MAGSNGFHQSQVQWDCFRFLLEKIRICLEIIIDTFKPVLFIALHGCFDKPTI
jgi:hypothetical protein